MTGKPDNSATFFSARKPSSTVLSMSFNTAAFGKPVDHPWRYFVAGGESLQKIEQVIADSKNVDAELKALAAEVGADEVNNGYFKFKNAEETRVAPQMRLVYAPNNMFVSNAAAPGEFFPNMQYAEGIAIREQMNAIKALPAAEQEAARADLAKKYKAESFDGAFFHFADWEEKAEPLQAKRELRLRLKSNPAFVRGPFDGDMFSVDWETDEGLRIGQKLGEIGQKRYPEQRFAEWVSSFELDISLSGRRERDRKSAEVEKIGDEWIIKVPVVVEGIFGADGKGGARTGEKEGWALPPGAKPIAVSEYYARLEKSGTLRALPTTAPKPN